MLNAVLNQDNVTRGPVTLVDRQVNHESSTFPSEVVTCRSDGACELTLFFKYAIDHVRHDYGHRRGVDYEAEVYRQVLRVARVTAPTFYGTHQDATSKRTWLILGYLDNTTRVSRSPDPDAMVKAPRWLGRFHAINQKRLSCESLPTLIRYDADYYLGWARRSAQFAAKAPASLPWLPTLCARFEDLIPHLLAAPATVIHGEFYPQNVLMHAGSPHPVDWESAAVAAGEIDLASLTDRWPAHVSCACERAYQQARWPSGAPSHFSKALQVARIYVHLRWLGDWSEVSAKDCRWRLDHLRAYAQRVGLVSP